MIEYKIAEDSDWERLFVFYNKVYRKHHPLQNQEFWNWQFGNENYGRAIIGIFENEIIAHSGIVLFEDYIFSMNLFIDEKFRSGDVYLKLLDITNQYRKQHFAVAVNQNTLPLLRLLKWYQYANLERRLILHPEYKKSATVDVLEPIEINPLFPKPIGHFWEQPTLKSIEFEDGSTAIVQNDVGGLRFVEIKNVKKVTQQAFEMGFKWCDYITSFNNPVLIKLENNNWKLEDEIDIPWLLNPIVLGSKSNITFLSKTPIDLKFYVSRIHADLGRVGSIIK